MLYCFTDVRQKDKELTFGSDLFFYFCFSKKLKQPMKTIIDIYSLGFIFALIYFIQIFKDDRGRIDRSDFFYSLLLSSMSWIAVLGLWVGSNAKRNR